jgi:hypothetical protein
MRKEEAGRRIEEGEGRVKGGEGMRREEGRKHLQRRNEEEMRDGK